MSSSRRSDENKKGFQDVDARVLDEGSKICGADVGRNGARGCAVLLTEGVTANEAFQRGLKESGAVVHEFVGKEHVAIVSYLSQLGTDLMAEEVPEGSVRLAIVGEGAARRAIICIDCDSAACHIVGAKQRFKTQKTEMARRAVATCNLTRALLLGRNGVGAAYLGWTAGSPIFDACTNFHEWERVNNLLLSSNALIKYDSMAQYAGGGGRARHLLRLWNLVMPLAPAVLSGEEEWPDERYEERIPTC